MHKSKSVLASCVHLGGVGMQLTHAFAELCKHVTFHVVHKHERSWGLCKMSDSVINIQAISIQY